MDKGIFRWGSNSPEIVQSPSAFEDFNGVITEVVVEASEFDNEATGDKRIGEQYIITWDMESGDPTFERFAIPTDRETGERLSTVREGTKLALLIRALTALQVPGGGHATDEENMQDLIGLHSHVKLVVQQGRGRCMECRNDPRSKQNCSRCDGTGKYTIKAKVPVEVFGYNNELRRQYGLGPLSYNGIAPAETHISSTQLAFALDPEAEDEAISLFLQLNGKYLDYRREVLKSDNPLLKVFLDRKDSIDRWVESGAVLRVGPGQFTRGVVVD